MGKTKDTGHLAHIVQYDASNNITIPAGLKVNGADNVMTAAAMTSTLGGYVPASRIITINGTAFDLTSDRSWTIAAGLTSFNTRTGAITLSSGDVTTALGFTPYNATNPAGYITGISFANVSAKPTTLAGYGITDAASSTHNHDTLYVPVGRTITINGTAFDLSANRSWTVSGTDSTKLPLAGGTMTGVLAFSNVTGNKIDFYFSGEDRYGIQVQSDVLRIHSGAQGIASGGIVFGKSTSTTFTEAMRIRNDGIVQTTGYLRTAGVTTNAVLFTGGTSSVDFGNALGQGTSSRSTFFRGNTNNVSVWWGGIDGNGANIPYGAIDATAGEFTFWRNSGGTGGGTWTNIMTMNASGLTMNSGSFIGSLSGNASSASYASALYLGGNSGFSITNSSWAGAGGYHGYSYTGGNYRFGFSSTGGYIDVYTDGNFYAGIDLNGSNNLVLHTGNYNSYAPTLTGGNASGTWGINISGTAAAASSSTYVSSPDGDRNPSTKLPTSNPRAVRFDFSGAGSTGGTGNYAGVMTYAPWDGTSASTGDSSYQLAFINETGVNASGNPGLRLRNGINSSWNGWHSIITSANIGSQKVNGAQKLWAESHPNDFYIVNNWTGSHWYMTSNHGSPVRVGYSDTSGGTNQRDFNYLRINSNDNLYLDYNHGCSIVGVYSSYRFQGVFSMGNSWKLAIDGTTPGNLYGLSWSHPNAGGQATRLNDHGLLVMINGVTQSALSSNIWAAGDITAYSDIRVKDNIEVIKNPLDKIQAIRGVTFTRNDMTDKTTRRAGVIAQEVLQVLPEVVTTNDEGMHSVAYGNIVSLLIEGIKEQQKRINSQDKTIEELKNLIHAITR